MAAIEVSGNARSAGAGRMRSRISTRVDMTPMVDLGFLLITFFMLATTMSKPTSMSVFFPEKNTVVDTEPIRASGVLTLFLGNHDAVYYLDGIAATDERAALSLKTTRPGFDLRNVIFAAKKRVAALPREGNDERSLIVVIKPTAVSSYKNMVDAMDEMPLRKRNDMHWSISLPKPKPNCWATGLQKRNSTFTTLRNRSRSPSY